VSSGLEVTASPPGHERINYIEDKIILKFAFAAGARRLEKATSKFEMGMTRASVRLGRSPTD